MKTKFPFLALPPELRLQIYKYLYPVPPEPPQCIEQGSLDPDQYATKGNWPSLLRACKQIRDEAEDEFYRKKKIKIGFYGISKDAFFYPKSPHCRTRIHLFGRYYDEGPQDDQRYLPRLLKVKNLEIYIFVTGDRQCVEHFWHLQDRLYRLVSGLSVPHAGIKKLYINLSIVNLVSIRPSPTFRDISDWSLYTASWPQMWDHSMFLLEPFQFLRKLDSAKIGTFSVWRFLGNPLENVRGPWPDAGPQGVFKKRIEELMTKKEPTTAFPEVHEDLYRCTSSLVCGCKHNETCYRLQGHVNRMSRWH